MPCCAAGVSMVLGGRIMTMNPPTSEHAAPYPMALSRGAVGKRQKGGNTISRHRKAQYPGNWSSVSLAGTRANANAVTRIFR